MPYKAEPMDTSGVELSDDILELTELLAMNVHAHWAARRIQAGWTYGLERNELRKETPVLVPYSELPEEEKEYDRKTALETLKTIIALGYSIEKKR
ncbi:MAG: RyR domain-containing protein [Syntrophomonas sp.]|nr:RyR domain-containing protein [Syntrophomonas sp.]